jgi:hypothetical protein
MCGLERSSQPHKYICIYAAAAHLRQSALQNNRCFYEHMTRQVMISVGHSREDADGYMYTDAWGVHHNKKISGDRQGVRAAVFTGAKKLWIYQHWSVSQVRRGRPQKPCGEGLEAGCCAYA